MHFASQFLISLLSLYSPPSFFIHVLSASGRFIQGFQLILWLQTAALRHSSLQQWSPEMVQSSRFRWRKFTFLFRGSKRAEIQSAVWTETGLCSMKAWVFVFNFLIHIKTKIWKLGLWTSEYWTKNILGQHATPVYYMYSICISIYIV